MSMMSWFKKMGGNSRFEKAADKYRPQVARVNALESKMEKLSDDEIRKMVEGYRGKSRDEIEKVIPEIFALVREAAKRTLKMRHFDVQILGGLVLLKDNIAEMKTGEGKTLVATLPMTVNALMGKGAHLVTVNDYLATRDAEWMTPVYEFLGLTVGVVKAGLSPEEKREAYAADVTYGTNNEFGFDYLRDNMAQSLDQMVQRKPHYALIDEVDSILIDEARTPLIISAPDTESTALYGQFARLVPQLQENTHYNIDEKRKAATLTDEGVSFVEERLGIDNMYAEKGIRFVHHLEQALRAQTLYQKDKDYVVQDGQVKIVDEFTGRMMEGRRYSEGLHQALEAKEGVEVQQESRTLASITFQNYFRLYEHLSGMTGTAVTSAEEFEKVYNLDVVVIPTNKTINRQDKSDQIFINEEAKFKAVVEAIKQRQSKGQPVLVGTIAIEKSEYLSALLTRAGVKHEVLNAKHHAREAEIVAQAGHRGAVTISTNMAGRGTDIKLGDGVAELGGLSVLGTERHEARRIDNQLRGRSGRQGDPGESMFFVSLDDDIMRIFGGSRIQGLMSRLKLPEDEPIEHKMISRALEGAQERVEGHYFDMRKQVLAYDDVLNRQRNAIYLMRRSLLESGEWKEPGLEALPLSEYTPELAKGQVQTLVDMHTGVGEPEDWNIEEIAETIHALTNQPLQEVHETLKAAVGQGNADGPEAAKKVLTEAASDLVSQRLALKEEQLGGDGWGKLLLSAALRAIDVHWMEHLDTMDYLRTGIGLRGYGQRDPLVEYQKEGHRLFQELLGTIKSTMLETVIRADVVQNESLAGVAQHADTLQPHRIADAVVADNQGDQAKAAPAAAGGSEESGTSSEPLKNPYKNVGRNDLCPCGSGKKFKKCHGA